MLLSILLLAQNKIQTVNENLIPFANAEEKWGYLDAETLTIKIQPKYDFVRLFQNGVAEVSIDNPKAKNYNEQNLYGLIDKTGKELFSPQFPYRYDVQTQDDSILPNRIEYVNTKGEKGIAKTDGMWLVPLGKYDSFQFYGDSLIVADKYVIIHNRKTYKLPEDFEIKWIDLKNKLVHFNKNELYEGVANLQGKIVVPPEYIDISYHPKSKRFLASKPKHKLTKSNALRLLRKLANSNDQEAVRTYLLDENGKEIKRFKSRYNPHVDEKTGTASFEKNGKMVYFSMKTGEMLSEHSVIGQKSKYCVFDKNRQQGVKNSSGKIVVPANYKRLRFLDSVTLIATDAETYKKGLIDVHGKTILPFYYRDLNAAGFGKLTAENEKGYGLIDKTGKVLTAFQFQNGIYFGEDGFASVYKKGKNGVVNSEGKIVVPINYDDLFNTHQLNETKETYFTASKNGKWGLLDSHGKTLVPFEYGYVSIKKEDFKLGWVNTEGLNRKKRGAVNLNTHIRIPPHYKFLRFHKNFIISAHYNDNHYSYGLLDGSGARVSEALYSELEFIHGYLLAERDGKRGIVSIAGKVLIPLEYDYIWAKTKDLIEVKKDNRYFYMNIDGKKYLPKP